MARATPDDLLTMPNGKTGSKSGMSSNGAGWTRQDLCVGQMVRVLHNEQVPNRRPVLGPGKSSRTWKPENLPSSSIVSKSQMRAWLRHATVSKYPRLQPMQLLSRKRCWDWMQRNMRMTSCTPVGQSLLRSPDRATARLLFPCALND